jgi:hypothetical protein
MSKLQGTDKSVPFRSTANHETRGFHTNSSAAPPHAALSRLTDCHPYPQGGEGDGQITWTDPMDRLLHSYR